MILIVFDLVTKEVRGKPRFSPILSQFLLNYLFTLVFIIFHTFVLSLNNTCRIKELTESNHILPFALLANILFLFTSCSLTIFRGGFDQRYFTHQSGPDFSHISSSCGSRSFDKEYIIAPVLLSFPFVYSHCVFSQHFHMHVNYDRVIYLVISFFPFRP